MHTLKELRVGQHINQEKLSKAIGVSRSTIAMWETGASQPDNDMLKKLSEYFNVTIDYLLENDTTKGNSIKAPVLGYVAAGIPIEAIEDIVDYEELDTGQFNSNYEYFGLKIQGDSMMPRMHDGDGVIVHKKVGDYVKEDEPIATNHANDESKFEEVKNIIVEAYKLNKEKVEKPTLIYDIVKAGNR